jgi:hypothetical protein
MSAEPPKDSVKECLTRAISDMVALYEEPRWQAWAQSWLSGQDRSEECAQVAFEFCLELAGGPGLEEAQRRLGIHTLEELDANREAFAEVFLAASPKPDSPLALFSQVAIGVACVLAGTALVMAACEKLGEDLEAMREDVLYAQRQVEDLESMHEIRDVLSSQE